MQRPQERRFFVLFTRYRLPVPLYVTIVIAISAQPYLVAPVDFRYADKLSHVVEYLGLGV